MRILMIHNYYQRPGGEDVVFAAEKSLLAETGHNVLTYTDQNRRLRDINKALAATRAVWSSESKRKVNAILQEQRMDVAHFHNVFALISPSAYWACKEHKVPVVQTLHNFRLLCPGAKLYRNGFVCEDCLAKTIHWPGVRHGCYRGSVVETGVVAASVRFHQLLGTWQEAVDVYIALTEFSRCKHIHGGIPEHKIMVKPNFVYPDPGVRISSGAFALFVGTIMTNKGIRSLLRAWRFLPNVPLKVVGGGPLLEETKEFVQKHNLTNVELLGQQKHKNVMRILKQAQFLIFPSECYEGFPMAIVEAMACGVPVIASRLGAMEEIVEDGRTGLHFSPGDEEELASKVEWACCHPKEMREVGREARREYEEKYTAERNCGKLMDIYRLAIQNACGSLR